MQVKFEDLKKIREKYKKQKITICAGWFDMFHIGHLSFLNKAKQNTDILVVVVMNDKGVKPLKGDNRPIINENQRIEIVDNIKAVDYTILSNKFWNLNKIKEKNNIGDDYKEQLLWQEYLPIIYELKPNSIFSLQETINYKSILRFIKSNNIKIRYTNYTNDISTTKIIEFLK